MNSGLNLLHGSKVVQTHQVETEAVQIVFLCPVADGVDHELTVHISFGSGVVATAGSGGVCAGSGVAVVVIRNDLVKGAVCVVGVVINHVHNYANAGVVERLHHFLILTDTDFTVVGIGGVAAFRNIVVLGIVAPVELAVGVGFVNGCIVVNGQQVDIVDAQLYQVVDTDALAVLVDKTTLGEGKVLALIPGVGDLVGEVSYVDFPNGSIGVGLDAGGELCAPAGGVGLGKVNDHAAVAIETGCLCVGVNSFLGAHRGGYGVCIIGTVTAGSSVRPYAAVTLGHFDALISGAFVTGGEEVQNHLGSGRCPYLEGGLVAIDDRTQIVTVIGVVFNEVGAVKNRGRNDFLLTVAFNDDTVALGNVHGFLDLDDAGGDFLANVGDVKNGQLGIAFVDLDLAILFDSGLGGQAVLDLMGVDHARKGKLLNHCEGLSSVVTGILGGIAAL